MVTFEDACWNKRNVKQKDIIFWFPTMCLVVMFIIAVCVFSFSFSQIDDSIPAPKSFHQWRQKRVRSTYETSGQLAGAYPGFCSMKQLGVFLLPPGWDASPSQAYPRHLIRWYMYPFIHLGGERHCKNTTQSPRPELEPRPLVPESNALTMRPQRLPIIMNEWMNEWNYIFSDQYNINTVKIQ